MQLKLQTVVLKCGGLLSVFLDKVNVFHGCICLIRVAEMEVSREDNSQSLSMALKQKDSKIGLLTQNLQQQETEKMALEAK